MPRLAVALFMAVLSVPLAIAMTTTVLVPGPCYAWVGPGGCPAWRSDDPAAGPAVLATYPIAEAGGRVFTAWADASGDVGVRAINATTGIALWTSLWAPTGNPYWHRPQDIVASADGGIVYVGGALNINRGLSDLDGFVLALDGATGAPLWAAFETGTMWWRHDTRAVALTPDGVTLLAATHSDSPVRGSIRVSAYDAATGAQSWVTEVADAGTSTVEQVADLTLSPDGATAFIAGARVAALSVDSGDILWSVPFGPDDRYAAGTIAVSPDGENVAAGGERHLNSNAYVERGAILDAVTGLVVAVHEEPGRTVRDVAWSSDDSAAIFAGANSTWALGPGGLAWTTANPTRIGLPGSAAHDVDARGPTIVATGEGGDWALDPATGALRWLVPAEAAGMFHTGITLSADGKRAWASLGDDVRAYVARSTVPMGTEG